MAAVQTWAYAGIARCYTIHMYKGSWDLSGCFVGFQSYGGLT